MPGMPAVTRRARASGPGWHYGPAGTGGSAEARTAIRSGPARRAVGVARVLWWPENLVELRVVAPQNPEKRKVDSSILSLTTQTEFQSLALLPAGTQDEGGFRKCVHATPGRLRRYAKAAIRTG